MARIRTIKPKLFRHEALQDLERDNPGCHCILAFIGLFGHCDKGGKFEWRPRQLKLDILPFLDFDMGHTLQLLADAGQIEHYEVGGKEYGRIPSFPEHQRINGKESQEPDLFPEPNGETPVKQSGQQEGKEEGKGKRKGKGAAPAPVEVSEEVRAWCQKNGYDHPEATLAYLTDYAAANGKRYDDWDAALRNAIKGDWGKARENARKNPRAAPVTPPRHKCMKCSEPTHGREWKGHIYCEKHWQELYQAEGDKKLSDLLARKVAA